jgi:hypothetical protein
MVFMMAAAFGSLVIVLSQVGLMINPASGPIAIMLKIPLAPPEPAARMKYVVPVAAKLTLAWLPAQDGPLSSLHITGLSELQLPCVDRQHSIECAAAEVLIATVPLNAGV